MIEIRDSFGASFSGEKINPRWAATLSSAAISGNSTTGRNGSAKFARSPAAGARPARRNIGASRSAWPSSVIPAVPRC